jgi:hypothetical protein
MKLFFVAISLTLGTAAVVKTVQLMNQAAAVMHVAMTDPNQLAH